MKAVRPRKCGIVVGIPTQYATEKINLKLQFIGSEITLYTKLHVKQSFQFQICVEYALFCFL